MGLDSVVNIEGSYELDGLGVRIHVKVKFPRPVRNGLGAYPTSYKMGMGSLSGWINGRIMALTNQALIAQRLRKSRAMPLPPCRVFMASSRKGLLTF